MSYTSETIVISGYKLPYEIWKKGFKYCEKHCETDINIPANWGDMFINMNPICNHGEVFFGWVIYTVPEDGTTKEFDTILADLPVITHVQWYFDHIFRHIYEQKGFPLPTYNKFIGMRYI